MIGSDPVIYNLQKRVGSLLLHRKRESERASLARFLAKASEGGETNRRRRAREEGKKSARFSLSSNGQRMPVPHIDARTSPKTIWGGGRLVMTAALVRERGGYASHGEDPRQTYRTPLLRCLPFSLPSLQPESSTGSLPGSP